MKKILEYIREREAEFRRLRLADLGSDGNVYQHTEKAEAHNRQTIKALLETQIEMLEGAKKTEKTPADNSGEEHRIDWAVNYNQAVDDQIATLRGVIEELET